ncbi:Gem-associated protein 2 [Plasmodiophora brassicae]
MSSSGSRKRARATQTRPGKAALPIDETQVVRTTGDAPPASADEYLLRVRMEARRIPFVVSKPVPADVKVKAGVRVVPRCVPMSPSASMPRPDWAVRFAVRFAELRQSLARVIARFGIEEHAEGLPHSNNASAWRARFVDESRLPSLSEIAALDQVRTRSILRHLAGVVRCDTSSTCAAVPEPVVIWIWSALLRLDKPLLPDTAATLRELYRSIATRRANADPSNHQSVALFNIVLTIIHHCFGQAVPMDSAHRGPGTSASPSPDMPDVSQAPQDEDPDQQGTS